TLAWSWMILLALAGCNESAECTLGSSEGCGEGLVCEAFPGDEARCTAPLFLEGRVFDAMTGEPVDGARVVALDANGGARSRAALASADGMYELRVSIPRNDEGQLQAQADTLRVDADEALTFPNPPRQAPPIDLDAAVEEESGWRVRKAKTDT